MRLRKILRVCWVAFALVVAVWIGGTTFQAMKQALPEKPPRVITRAEFLNEVDQGHVAKIEVEDGLYVTGESSTLGPFQAEFRVDKEFAKALRNRGVQVGFTRGVVSP